MDPICICKVCTCRFHGHEGTVCPGCGKWSIPASAAPAEPAPPVIEDERVSPVVPETPSAEEPTYPPRRWFGGAQ